YPGPIPRVDNYDVIRAKFIVDSLDHKMMTTFSKNANEFRDEGRVRPNSNLGAIGECPQKQEVDLADVRTFEITIANTNSRIVITIYAQTYTTYFFNRGEKMLKASAILKNELLQDNYRCSHGNKIGLVISIADIKIRKCDHGNHKFYAYSMCMLFSAIYYFKLEFKFEYPITMRTLSEIWTKFMENEEIMTYIDSEEGEENDGAISVDMVNQSPRKFIILLEKHLV
ncbi:9987_t:CDS:2, partial [Entrophospora sp. SA101]